MCKKVGIKLLSEGLKIKIFLLFFFYFASAPGQAQQKGDVFVDEKGVMRWGNNKEEVKGFGVNYSVPFAHAFRTAEKLRLDVKEAIDNDVYHFSRLGFDLFRIHVWDTEISDEEGNLIENEHLETFDYLLQKLKENNINYVITPIAFWGNGWPEPDEDTPGFSNKYGKENSLTDPGAIRAQQNYLTQFLNHKNKYTGIAYKDEPNIIAFEISNEPHHKGQPKEVTTFIDKMVTAMRSTGTKKPIFYNVSHSVHLAEAYFDAGIQGGTFQWYPTGLGFQKELEGNLLSNVDEYNIPFNNVIEENNAAKLVYEFDAADVMRSYMYPAMARSFREAGIQIATHFAYDPTFMAFANTEYNTHYMNLVYTPQKALALMISGEIFHHIPMNKDWGTYPENLEFGDFKINYLQDLATYNSGEKFIYTNTNSQKPKQINRLKKIAGYGNSEIVKYEGKGAYFLDKLEEGIWRLEVMPDAILVDNPFGKNSLEKTVAVINHHPWEMTVNLPELGEAFQVEVINKGNSALPKVSQQTFLVEPGTYILSKMGKKQKSSYKGWARENLNAFVAPEGTVKKTYVLHEPIREISEGRKTNISAEVISKEEIKKVEAWFRNGNTYKAVELQPQEAYTYTASVPDSLLRKGFLEYRIIVSTAKGSYTFPAGVAGNPAEWDFYNKDKYLTRIVKEEAPVYLFDAAIDSEKVVGEWLPGLNLVPTKEPVEAEYQVHVKELFEKDEENPNAEPVYDYSFRYNFNKKVEGRRDDIKEKDTLILKARSLKEKPVKLQVAFVMENGSSFGKIIELTPEIEEHKIVLSDLKPVQTVTLPRPYPTFLPYYFEHNNSGTFDRAKVESLQFSIGPGLLPEEQKEEQGVGIISVRLQ